MEVGKVLSYESFVASAVDEDDPVGVVDVVGQGLVWPGPTELAEVFATWVDPKLRLQGFDYHPTTTSKLDG